MNTMTNNSSIIIGNTNVYLKYMPELNKIRSYASQFSAAFAINALKFTSGTFNGITTIIIAEFYTEDVEIKMTIDEVTWFNSHCFTLALGFLTSGILAQNIGSRRTMLIAAIIYITCCLTFYFSTNVAMFLIVQAVVGLNIPMSMGPSYVYIVETAEPQLRSILLATGNLSVIIGSCFTILMANFIHWRTIVLVNIIFPVIGLLTVYILPESPHWLAIKGKLREAEIALLWLRGWTKPTCIESELKSFKDSYKFVHNNISSHESANGSKKYLKNSLMPYFTKPFYLPLASVIYMFFANSCVGSYTLQSYCIVIFEMMDAPIGKYVAAIIFDAIRGIGSFLCIFVIHYTGKRKLLFFSLISAGLSYAIIAITLLLKEKESVVSNMYLWIPVVMFFASTFLTSVGSDKVVFMLNSELFPTKFRNVGVGIGLLAFSIFLSVANKVYLFIVDILTLQGTFLFFSLASFISLFSFYFILPETEGKSLMEIEEHYAKAKNSSNKTEASYENTRL